MQLGTETRVALYTRGKKLGIHRNLLLAPGISDPSKDHVAEAFEAILGAVYVDSGHQLSTVKEVITSVELDTHRLLKADIQSQDAQEEKELAQIRAAAGRERMKEVKARRGATSRDKAKNAQSQSIRQAQSDATVTSRAETQATEVTVQDSQPVIDEDQAATKPKSMLVRYFPAFNAEERSGHDSGQQPAKLSKLGSASKAVVRAHNRLSAAGNLLSNNESNLEKGPSIAEAQQTSPVSHFDRTDDTHVSETHQAAKVQSMTSESDEIEQLADVGRDGPTTQKTPEQRQEKSREKIENKLKNDAWLSAKHKARKLARNGQPSVDVQAIYNNLARIALEKERRRVASADRNATKKAKALEVASSELLSEETPLSPPQNPAALIPQRKEMTDAGDGKGSWTGVPANLSRGATSAEDLAKGQDLKSTTPQHDSSIAAITPTEAQEGPVPPSVQAKLSTAHKPTTTSTPAHTQRIDKTPDASKSVDELERDIIDSHDDAWQGAGTAAPASSRSVRMQARKAEPKNHSSKSKSKLQMRFEETDKPVVVPEMYESEVERMMAATEMNHVREPATGASVGKPAAFEFSFERPLQDTTNANSEEPKVQSTNDSIPKPQLEQLQGNMIEEDKQTLNPPFSLFSMSRERRSRRQKRIAKQALAAVTAGDGAAEARAKLTRNSHETLTSKLPDTPDDHAAEPVSTLEPDKEPTPQPDQESIPQSETELALKSDQESPVQSEEESATLSKEDTTTQPEKETSSQVEEEVSVQPKTESTSPSEQEPYAQSETEPTSQPVTEPTSQPVTEPTSQPVTEPTSQPVTEPTPQPETDSTSQPETEPTPQPDASSPEVSTEALQTAVR
jgi:hypothetical protein